MPNTPPQPDVIKLVDAAESARKLLADIYHYGNISDEIKDRIRPVCCAIEDEISPIRRPFKDTR